MGSWDIIVVKINPDGSKWFASKSFPQAYFDHDGDVDDADSKFLQRN